MRVRLPKLPPFIGKVGKGGTCSFWMASARAFRRHVLLVQFGEGDPPLPDIVSDFHVIPSTPVWGATLLLGHPGTVPRRGLPFPARLCVVQGMGHQGPGNPRARPRRGDEVKGPVREDPGRGTVSPCCTACTGDRECTRGQPKCSWFVHDRRPGGGAPSHRQILFATETRRGGGGGGVGVSFRAVLRACFCWASVHQVDRRAWQDCLIEFRHTMAHCSCRRCRCRFLAKGELGRIPAEPLPRCGFPLPLKRLSSSRTSRKRPLRS